MLLLQTDTLHTLDTVATATQAVADPEQQIRFIDLLIKGGWIMLPIGLLFFIGLVIFVERYLTIRKASKYDSNLMTQIKQSVLSGRLDAALAVCRSNESPMSRMLQKGLVRIGRPIKDIEGAIENVGKLEVAKLEKNINVLGIIAGIAPMLGFVGTIIGVITIFHNVEIAGGIDIGSVSGGLYVKMVSSASGLIIGILAYVGFHILNMMVDRLILRMESDAIEFVDLLDEPGR
ncbi:outer membrane transport energization protein ExbB [bacterium A37T11]|nr:outer membrane transport energization protein ExbB [bacterium A37T11]